MRACRIFSGMMSSTVDSAPSLLPPNYQSLTAQEKQDILWEQISRDPYSNDNLPTESPSLWNRLSLSSPPYLEKSLTHTSDESPRNGQKLIHMYGSLAKIDFRVTTKSKFTGLFQSGGIGIARLSLAVQNESLFIPGMAVKILLDGQPSVNFIVMNALQGQGTNKNFFAKPFRNFITDETSLPVWLIGRLSAFNAARCLLPGGPENRPESETNLPLYEHAAVDSSGRPVEKIFAPYVAVFTPNPDIAWSPDTTEDLRVNLGRISPGTVLYTVSLQREKHSEEEKIGEIVTTSPFVSSKYGDEGVFFQHSHKRWEP